MKDTTSLQDEIRLSRKQLKDSPFSKKLGYFWDYYRYHVIVIIVLALFLGNFLHSVLSRKDIVLSIAYINAFPNVEDEIFIEDFEQYLDLNPKKQEVLLDSGYYIDDTSASPYSTTYHQKFSTRCMSGMLDVVLADETNFISYGKQSFFTDLREILSDEELDFYSDALLYVKLSSDAGSESIPIGIEITSFPKILSTSSYPNSHAYFGIIHGSDHTQAALSYLEYLNHDR